MRNGLQLLFTIFFASAQLPLHANAQLDSAIAGDDASMAIDIYTSTALNDEETETLVEWIAKAKEKYRKRLTRQISDKQRTDAASGKHIHNELLRLIKENKVEDDIDYTELCLKVAGPNKNPDLIYTIAPFLVHPQASLRAEANRAVAIRRDERIYPLVGQLLAADNAIDKIYAMETLLALKDERAVPLLLLQLSNSNKNVRYFALKTLEAIASDKAQYGVIHLAQNEADEEVRLKAVEILRQFKTGPVFSALQKLISDGKIPIRARALESALAQNDKRYANAISEQLVRETEIAQKHALLRGLLALGSGGGMNGVLALLKKENDVDLLLWSAHACIRFNEQRCADPVSHLLATSPEETIVLEALVALGVFRQKKHLQQLLSVLHDASRAQIVRSAALASIMQYDSEATMQQLFVTYDQEKEQAIRVQVKLYLVDLMKRKLPKL
jgi:HEAT repeat protein